MIALARRVARAASFDLSRAQLDRSAHVVSLVTASRFRFCDAVSGYAVAPLFLIRLAGVPFDVVERLETPATMAAARTLLARRVELTQRDRCGGEAA